MFAERLYKVKSGSSFNSQPLGESEGLATRWTSTFVDKTKVTSVGDVIYM
jgi:hypothetical protein